jgi:AcrR family transcriptional regulator
MSSQSAEVPPVRLTTTRRLSAQTAVRLAAIRQDAVKLAEQRGYDEFSMQDVATAAGVSRTTLYKHYPSKDHLLIDALRDIWPKETPPVSGSSASRVRAYLLGVFDWWLDRPLLLDAMTKATINIDFSAWTMGVDEPTFAVVRGLLDDVSEARREPLTHVILHVFGGTIIQVCHGLDAAAARAGLDELLTVVLEPDAE